MKQIKKYFIRQKIIKVKAKVAVTTDKKGRRKTGGGTDPSPVDELIGRVDGYRMIATSDTMALAVSIADFLSTFSSRLL